MTPARQHAGVSLPMAMIMLVALMIGAIALFRAIDTSTLVAGNLAFKQGATMAADRGIEAAVKWLSGKSVPATPGALNNSDLGNGYCSSLHNDDSTATGWDPTTKWSAACTPVALATDAAGNQVDYLVHRLCAEPDKAPSLQPGKCSVSGGSSTGDAATSSRRSDRDLINNNATNIAYRITVRVRSDRGTRSFVQTTVLIPDNSI